MISVVIPLYNKEATIVAAIQSVQAQTLTDWALIVVDDGSRDAGPRLVAACAAQDSRIRLVQQANAGVSVARNQGVALASSDVIAFLDADDVWLPGHLANLASLQAWMPDAPMWAAAYRLIDDVGTDRVVRVRDAGGRYVITDYFAESVDTEFPVHSSAVMVNRTALQKVGGFPVGVGSGEDLITWARLSCLGAFPFSCDATAVYVSPSVSPDARLGVVRRPVTPDYVAGALLLLQNAHPGLTASIRSFMGLWQRIRAMSYLELNQRVACVDALIKAVALSGLKKRDVLSVALCCLPWSWRTQMLARSRGYRAAKWG